MADGSIAIETTLDDAKTQKDLDELNEKIKTMKQEQKDSERDYRSELSKREKLYSALQKRQDNLRAAQERTAAAFENQSPVVQQINAVKAEIAEAKKAVEEYRQSWLNGNPTADQEQSKAQEKLNGLKERLAELNIEVGKYDKEIQRAVADEERLGGEVVRASSEYNNAALKVSELDAKLSTSKFNLEEAEKSAGELSKKLSEAGYNADKVQKNVKKADKSAKSFSSRMKAVVRSALVFTVITQALSKFRNWIGDVVKASPEASAAIAKLKGALLTMVQPLVNIVVPAFTKLVNVLTIVIGKIAQFFALLSGGTLDSSKQAAKALNDQTEALNGTGSAAKKAGKSLANFDEINKLSTSNDSGSGSSSEIAPDFNFEVSEFTGDLEWLLDMVLLIGSALAAWKISSALGMGLKESIGLFAALYYAMQFVKDILDIWNNGADWDNVIGAISAAAIVAGALSVAFGKTAAGISLIITGAVMVVTAFNDIINNGENLQNTLLLIAGIIATGLGFFLLTGSIIPMVIAAVASVIVAILGLTGNLEGFMKNFKENILGGLIDFITGVFTGDWEKAWEGVKKIFSGVWASLVMIFESVINLIIKGLNWVIDKMNGLLVESFIAKGLELVGINFTGIPNIPNVDLVSNIPALAQGAVIPPNREFLAVLGDQKSGTNIETPLPTMIQAFKQALLEMEYANQSEAYLMLDDVQLGKVIYKLNKAESNRVGVNLAGV